MRTPALSIITICFENPEELKKTLVSVGQKYEKGRIEQIVIDGSRDYSCQEVVRQNPWVDHVIHEEDGGRYDAMNKGIKKAKGKSFLFLNSGDCLSADCDTQNITNQIDAAKSDQILYGDVVMRVGSVGFFRSAPTVVRETDFAKGLAPSHQAVIFPSGYCKDHFYNTSLSISADTKFMIDAFNKLPSCHLGHNVTIFSVGGASNAWCSIGDVVHHWQEKRRARGVSAMGYAPNLVKSIIKYCIMKIVGVEKYYAISLRRKSSASKIE
jgi:glycosyltransferase involved in cell wall biosynthesis